MSSIASCLHIKNMLETAPENQSPPASPGPRPAKADDQHKVSTVALMFTTFINQTVSDSLFGTWFKKRT